MYKITFPLENPGKEFYDFLVDVINPFLKTKKVYFVQEENYMLGPYIGINIFSNKSYHFDMCEKLKSINARDFKKQDKQNNAIYIYSFCFPDDKTSLIFKEGSDFDYELEFHVNCNCEDNIASIRSQIHDASSLFIYGIPFIQNQYIRDYFEAEINKYFPGKENVHKRFMLLRESLYTGKLVNLSSKDDIQNAITNFKIRNQHISEEIKKW